MIEAMNSFDQVNKHRRYIHGCATHTCVEEKVKGLC